MLIVDRAIFAHHDQGWHAAHPEQVDLLSIAFCHTVLGVGQAHEGQTLLFPVSLEGQPILGADNDDFRVTAEVREHCTFALLGAPKSVNYLDAGALQRAESGAAGNYAKGGFGG